MFLGVRLKFVHKGGDLGNGTYQHRGRFFPTRGTDAKHPPPAKTIMPQCHTITRDYGPIDGFWLISERLGKGRTRSVFLRYLQIFSK